MKKPTRQRGMTLIETLVSAVVGLGILVTVGALLIQGLNMWVTAQRHASAQQSALKAMHRMTSDLQQSDVKTVTAYRATSAPNRDGFSFLSAQQGGTIQHNQYGEIVWQKHVVYYRDASSATLRRHEVALTTPDEDPDDLTLTTFTPDDSDTIVANDVRALSASTLSGGNPVSVTITCGDDTVTSTLSGSVVLENGVIKAYPYGRPMTIRPYLLSFGSFQDARVTFCNNILTNSPSLVSDTSLAINVSKVLNLSTSAVTSLQAGTVSVSSVTSTTSLSSLVKVPITR